MRVVLVVAPHPDDETLGVGGTLLRHVAEGDAVHWLIATASRRLPGISDEEAQAMKYGLRRFPITEEESFFFGMVVQTQFGVEKAIPFFSPDRQNFAVPKAADGR